MQDGKSASHRILARLYRQRIALGLVFWEQGNRRRREGSRLQLAKLAVTG
jgi:hypothetical protein